MLQIKFMSTYHAYCEIHLSWMPEKTFDDKSTFVQVTVKASR